MQSPEHLTDEQLADYEGHFQRGWKLLSKVPSLHQRRGGALGFFERRNIAGAIEAFEACVSMAPDGAPGLWGLGTAHHSRGDPDAAYPLLQKAAATEPADATLSHELSLVAMALGHGDVAEHSARVAVDSDPENPELLINYTRALLVAGQTKRALGVIANLCKRDPNNGPARDVIVVIRRILNGEQPSPERLTADGI